ncbi:MAG: hypothetical protein PHQ86_07845 [Dehalococcoidales bacterium]|nr:hypothetical protein [Dehalococcoidales bacterium]
MAKMTITLEGDVEELAPILNKLGEIKDMKKSYISAKPVSGEEWTKERVLSVWNDLSEGAKTVLSVIARNDDKSWPQQVEATGWTANTVGGALSSLGSQLRNHGLTGITYPLSDNELDGYVLLPIWKEIVLENTEET